MKHICRPSLRRHQLLLLSNSSPAATLLYICTLFLLKPKVFYFLSVFRSCVLTFAKLLGPCFLTFVHISLLSIRPWGFHFSTPLEAFQVFSGLARTVACKCTAFWPGTTPFLLRQVEANRELTLSASPEAAVGQKAIPWLRGARYTTISVLIHILSLVLIFSL